MMIKVSQGKLKRTVTLVRIAYSAERKRGVQHTIASFPAHASAIPEELTGTGSPLTDAEMKQLKSWFAARADETMKTVLPFIASHIIRDANQLAEGLESPETASLALKRLDHLALYDALDRLGAALRKHGKTRLPRKSKAAEGGEETLNAQAA
jgi:hypothetical protein